MVDSDDVDDPVIECSCGFVFHRSQAADDSSPGSLPSFVCPLCGVNHDISCDNVT